jgi:hypothetical protein
MRERYHHVYGQLFGATLVPLRDVFRGGVVTPSISALSTSETVEYQAGDAGDSREILVEGKNANAMF